MRRVENPELKRRVLKHLAHLYKIDEVRGPNHLSDYVYCRTKGFLNQKQATEPTDEEVMLFALGYGLQDVLTPKDAVAHLYEKEGVIYRPDMSFQAKSWDGEVLMEANAPFNNATEVEQLVELKTTRKSAKFHYMDEHLPETWLAYMKGGCYLRGTSQYDLIVLYMMGAYSPPFPQLYCDTFIFDEQEIVDNWMVIQANKKVLDDALKSGQIPTPFQHCYSWECKYCRFQLVCKTVVQALGADDKTLQEDKKLWT